MQALLFATVVGVGIMTCGCDASGAEPSSRPSQSDATSKPATTRTGLDIETARRALIAMIEASNDAELKTKLPDLLKEPEGGYGDTRKYRTYLFGPRCQITPFENTWIIDVIRSGQRNLFTIQGKFREKEGGGWEAVETARGGPGARGGIPASH